MLVYCRWRLGHSEAVELRHSTPVCTCLVRHKSDPFPLAAERLLSIQYLDARSCSCLAEPADACRNSTSQKMGRANERANIHTPHGACMRIHVPARIKIDTHVNAYAQAHAGLAIARARTSLDIVRLPLLGGRKCPDPIHGSKRIAHAHAPSCIANTADGTSHHHSLASGQNTRFNSNPYSSNILTHACTNRHLAIGRDRLRVHTVQFSPSTR